MLYSLIDFKRAFTYYIVYQLFLSNNITFVQLPGIPLLTIDTAMLLGFIALYYFYYKKRYKATYSFPFIKPLIFIGIVYTIAFFFSAAGMNVALSQYALQMCSQVFFPILIWNILEKKDDAQVLIKILSIVFIFICLYAIVEWMTESNPFIEYEQSLISDSNRVFNGIYDDNEFRGRRVQSVFEHPIGGGVNFAIYAIMVFTILFKYPFIYKIQKIHIATAVICLICVVLTNSRGPILFCLIGTMSYINIKNARFRYGAIAALIAFIVIAPYFTQYGDTVLSLFSSSVRKNYVGSDEKMRIEQFVSAFSLIKDSPVWGVGFNFTKAALNRYYMQGLLGLESLWLWAIVQCGLLGVISTFYYMCSTLVIPIKRYASYTVFWIFAAYWISASLTSFPGMKMGLFYFVAFLFLRSKLNMDSNNYKKKYG